MKKTIILCALLLTAGMATTYARSFDDGRLSLVNGQISQSFRKDFGTAKNVSWEQKAQYVKATFDLNDQVMFAYYKQNGELLAVVRNILSDRLPISLLVQYKKNYKDYWISDLFEMATENQTTYYMSLSNGHDTLILKSDDSSQWEMYKTGQDSSL